MKVLAKIDDSVIFLGDANIFELKNSIKNISLKFNNVIYKTTGLYAIVVHSLCGCQAVEECQFGVRHNPNHHQAEIWVELVEDI